MLRWLILVVVASFVSLPMATVEADALADFESAQQAYHDQRYAVAAGVLEGLIAAIDPTTADPAIIIESRKYLGASYLFLGRHGDAERQFRLLLVQDRSYQIDPAIFPREVVDRFEAVRASLEAERAAERETALAEAEARVAAQEARLVDERARYAELYRLATTSPVMRANSRLVAVLPFGIGQFQNRRRGLGRFFAIAEGATLGLYVAAYAWYNALGRVNDVTNVTENLRWHVAHRAARWTNWVSGASFLTLTISGAIEAEVNFVPMHRATVPRDVPEQFRPRETPEARVTTQLSVSPMGLQLRVDF